jgi:limonene-1,2-epoxide hydrolase
MKTESKNKQLVQDIFTKLCNQDHTLFNYLTDDFTFHTAAETHRTKEQFKKQVFSEYNAFQGINVEIKRLIAEGDVVVAEYVWKAKHVGDYHGIPASQHMLSVPFIDVFDIEDGKVKKWRDLFNWSYWENQMR